MIREVIINGMGRILAGVTVLISQSFMIPISIMILFFYSQNRSQFETQQGSGLRNGSTPEALSH